MSDELRARSMDGQNITLASALSDAKERYSQGNPVSRAMHKKALKPLPGGNT